MAVFVILVLVFIKTSFKKTDFWGYFSDLRNRIAMEGDAITRAKEFLRRQRRSVQRRQVSFVIQF